VAYTRSLLEEEDVMKTHKGRERRKHPRVKLRPRTEVPLEFSFPNHPEPLVIIGEVVWVVEGTHSGMGIQYKKIPPDAQKVLREVVQSRVNQEKNP